MRIERLYIYVLFAVLSGCSAGYQNDGNAVYYVHWNEADGEIKNKLDADPKSFKVLKYSRYAKDKQTVYYEGKVVQDADAPTFEPIYEWFAKDKNRGYDEEHPIASSKGQTFSVIDGYYTTDGTNIFLDTLPLNVCSVRNFHFVFTDGNEDEWQRWTTDGCFYYYMNFKVPSDDYAHMKIYKNSGGFSKDRKYVYFFDHKLNYDEDGKKAIDTIDVASFEVKGYLECQDKWGPINPYHGRINSNDK